MTRHGRGRTVTGAGCAQAGMLLVAAMVLVGCSMFPTLGGDDVDPYSVGFVNDPYPELEPAQEDPDGLSSLALAPAQDPDPVVSVTGSLQVRDQDGVSVPADLDVLEVHATGLSTVLRVRVRAQEPVLPADDVWDTDRMGYYFDTVTLEVPGELVLAPSFFRYAEGVFGKNCLCSELIGQVGSRGVTFFTYYGPLPEGTSEVGVSVAGFDPVLVPVTWADQ